VPPRIIGPVAPAVKRFYQTCLASADGLGVGAGLALPIRLHGRLRASKRRSLEVLGDATLVHWRGARSVCRWLARLRFPIDPGHEHAGQRLLALAARQNPGGTGFALFDGTDTKRGGLAKSHNTRRDGKKPKHTKGGRPRTQTHPFVLGLWRLPGGLRLPLPRQRWYSRADAKAHGLAYRRQVEQVEELLRWLQPLRPARTPRVVRAASSLGARHLMQLGRPHGWTLITKLRTDRTVADAPGPRVGASGQSLAADKFRRCRLCRGREATAAYRRPPPRKARAHEKRVSAYDSERRPVSRAGEVRVVSSWKTPASPPRRTSTAATLRPW
jgi:hypothetical protein